jgi:hypothetical protein
VITKPYVTGSRREAAVNAEIESETGAFLSSAEAGGGEKAGSLVLSFGKGGAISRDDWWNGETQGAVLSHSGRTLEMGLDEIYRRTLEHSNQVKVFAALPLIRETAID